MNWTRAGDFGLWAGLSFLVFAESGARQDPLWMQASCVAVLAAAILLRRSRPVIGLSLVITAEVVILAVSLGTTLGVPIALVPAISLLSYVSGRRETQLRQFVIMSCCQLSGLLVLSLIVRPAVPVTETVLSWLLILLLSLLVVVLPWLIGRYRAQQALLATAGWDRAERIEREHRMEIAQERLRERSRIAEDMHDSVGHELSLIALRAAALEVDADLPDRHRRAATELREAAATATERLGEIIGVLRDGEASVVPAQETVGELVDRAAASGLAVKLVQEGNAELSPMVDRAVHRVVQESLTNASKHAPGAEVTVTVSHADDQVEVHVTNTTAPNPGTGTGTGTGTATQGGRGLAGLAERVRLVGGTLTAAPRSTGGFGVLARIPQAGGRPEPEVPAESATADERATVRRNARRGLITVVAAPVAIGAVVGLVALGYYLIVGYSSILRPADYQMIQLGQSADQVEQHLPAMQMVDPPSGRLPQPKEWNCRFYRPDAPFSINYAYRLCFHDGVLVAKDIVATGSVQPTPEGTP
ncbi:sensor histidine kinase [Kribbella catacumbae]|uniref:sensor histidine kinase n=1 Tax=Kribbella catacumbae TaxID=460086 RepID=UPI00037CF674|nr:histidine kinase [Kribbella catacumbae]